jgi:hypothetical protein
VLVLADPKQPENPAQQDSRGKLKLLSRRSRRSITPLPGGPATPPAGSGVSVHTATRPSSLRVPLSAAPGTNIILNLHVRYRMGGSC